MRIRRFVISLLIMAAFVHAPAFAMDNCYYSPVDRMLYFQYVWGDPAYRCLDGGRTITRIPPEVPGMICSSEPIPGLIFCMPYLSSAFDSIMLYCSTDSGSTWELTPGVFPGDMFYREGCAGANVGESFLRGDDYTFFTSDRWQTRDSIPRRTENPNVLTYWLFNAGEMVLGGAQAHTYLISSDTGRTWDSAHPIVIGAQQIIADAGADGEIWIHDLVRTGDSIYVIQNRGEITRAVMKIPPVPQRYVSFYLLATERPGEAYCIVDSLHWPRWDFDVWIYHIQNYGAQIDTFYHRVFYTEAQEIPVVQDFRVKAYPNPFNGRSQIEFVLSSTQMVSLRLYDLLGREVMTLSNAVQSPGVHRVPLIANGLASGVYFCRMRAGGVEQTTKIVLMK